MLVPSNQQNSTNLILSMSSTTKCTSCLLAKCFKPTAEIACDAAAKRRRSESRKKESSKAAAEVSESVALQNQEWVCCDGCKKWFSLPEHISARDMPEQWLCSMAWWISPAPICCNGTTDPDEDADGLPRDPDRRRSRAWLTSISGQSSIAAVLQDAHLRLVSSSAYAPSAAAVERWGRGWGWRKALASPDVLLKQDKGGVQPPPSTAGGPPSPASTRTSSSAAGEAPALIAQRSPGATAQDVQLIQFGQHCVGDTSSSSDLRGGGQLPGPEMGPAATAITSLLTARRLQCILQHGSASAAEVLHLLICAARDVAASEQQAGTPATPQTQALIQELQLSQEVASLVADLEDAHLRCPAVAEAVESRLRYAACLGLITAVQARIGGVRYKLPPSTRERPPHTGLPPALRHKKVFQLQPEPPLPAARAPPSESSSPDDTDGSVAEPAQLPPASSSPSPSAAQPPAPGAAPRRTRWAPAGPSAPAPPAAAGTTTLPRQVPPAVTGYIPPPSNHRSLTPSHQAPPAVTGYIPPPGNRATPLASTSPPVGSGATGGGRMPLPTPPSNALVPERGDDDSSEEEGEVIM